MMYWGGGRGKTKPLGQGGGVIYFIRYLQGQMCSIGFSPGGVGGGYLGDELGTGVPLDLLIPTL